MSRGLQLALAAALSLSSGCGARYYGTIQTGRPAMPRATFDQLAASKRIGVMPLSFAKVRFRSSNAELTEDQAFEGKRAEKRASWDEDKRAMAQVFSLAIGTAGEPFQLAPVASVESANVDFVLVPEAVLVDPGYFATALFNADALLVVHYDLVRVSDKSSVLAWTDKEESNVGAASGTRLRAAALRMGSAAFLAIRAVASPAQQGAK